jgi:hypothetical protein
MTPLVEPLGLLRPPALGLHLLFRRLVECIPHPIRERLAVFLRRFLPGRSFGVVASKDVLRRERLVPFGVAPRPLSLSTARHKLHVLHTPEVYSNYFDIAIRFHLISHCDKRITSTYDVCSN